MLLITSYTLVLSFFWLLFMGLAIVQRLRQIRMERIELGIQPSAQKSTTHKHFLAYIHSPLDEMQVWHQGKPAEKTERVSSPLVLPLRYQQTLLFADELGETHPNPALSKAS